MKTILIADDDPMMVKLLEFNLRRSGYAVAVCREGLSVCDRARAEHPDMAILDVMLPGRTGLELLRDFKADPQLSTLPVLIVTSEGKGSTQDDLLAAGALNVYTKPFSPTMLMERVRQLLGDASIPATK
ncbi:MAG TPA: response regulator [Opitutales bacterium]|jgi:DNA-binding response OmpR family regulator|nr:response regulator [Opitutales bacterium]